MSNQGKQLLIWALRVGVSMGLLAAIVLVMDSAELWQQFVEADLAWFALAVVLGVVANIACAHRWFVIAQRIGLNARFYTLLLAYGRGVSLNSLLPGATLSGDAYRAVVLQQSGNPMSKAVACVALDRLSGLWALVVISAMAWLAVFLVNAPALPPSVVILHGIGLGGAIILPFMAHALNARLGLPPQAWVSRSLRLLANTARLALVTAFSSAFIQVVTIFALWSALQAVGSEVSLLYLFAVAAPVFLVAALPISIGGFGLREAAVVGYFSIAEFSTEIAMAGALLFGLSVTVQGALWTSLFLVKQRTAIPSD